MNQAKYVGYPSLANAFTVPTEESSFSMDLSAVRGRHGYGDLPKEEALIDASHSYGSDLSQVADMPYPQNGHRRAQSESAFRLPDDIIFDYQPSSPTDDLGEKLLEMNLNEPSKPDKMSSSGVMMQCPTGNTVDMRNPHAPYAATSHHSRSLSVDHVLAGFGTIDDTFGLIDDTWTEFQGKPKHSHGNSMDGYLNTQKEASPLDSSKSISASKLAELALIDPKHAKRIIANRQSAARSKERKMRYIAELQRKVQALQAEARTLSAQLTIMQNDTAVLTQENSELKFQLQTIKQQTHQSNDLNRYLKQQVRRLQIAMGQISFGIGQIMSHEDHPLLLNIPPNATTTCRGCST